MIEFGWQTGTAASVQPTAPQPGEISVAAPPARARATPGVTLTRLLPAGMAAVMIVVSVLAYRSGSPVARTPILAVFPAMMLLSAIATAVTGRTAGSASIDGDRDDYLAYLSGLRVTVTGTAAAQRSALSWAHPEPGALWTLAGSTRMWERRPDDPDFGRVRVGVGSVPLVTRLVRPPRDRAGGIDPVTDTALRRFLDAHATVPEVPVAVPVLGPDPVRVDGEPDRARGLLRAMICQLAVLHPPETLLIAVVADSRRAHWDWLKWLPHHQHPSAHDSAGAARMTYPTLAAAEAGLAGLAGRAVVVVDDGAEPCIGELGADPAAGLRLRASDAVRLDFLAPIDAEVCARRLAGSRPATRGRAAPGWPELLGIADLSAVDAQALWDSVRAPDRLCVPIGTDAAGNPVRLDIKEAAQQGSGPHGLCIGATGSGKSEFLRTVVLGMMARHSPETLNLVLVDFKGGATFLGLQHARHVAAVITNLADEAVLVDRMRDALTGELTRRQEALRAEGCGDVTAYAHARRTDASLPVLPALLVVVDEFSELLSQHPDFIDVFVAIGRLGRSLGVHLLLASQRLDEGRLRGLESHLSYRICLKTMSATESRLVLGVPDAHELPTTPGRGYLRTAAGELTGFQAAFVSGACPRTEPMPPEPRPGIRLFTAASDGPAGIPAVVPDGRTVLQAMLARLSGQGPPARQVWLPPLDESPALGGLLGGEQRELSVPIGIVDRPFEQRRTPLLVDLGAAAGNVAVVGAPQSGKSNALVTLISALAATHDATRVQFYCLDFGGGALGALRDLPQVGTVAGRGQPDLVRRTVDEMEAILARREALFAEHGIGSMAQYRQLRAAARTGVDDPFGDVFLVIDGWAGLCRDFDRLEAPVVALAGRGLSFGVHVMLTASRWAEVRPGLRDLIGTRIELRLGDPADSELDRRQADRVPRDRPGRGLTHDGLHMLIARPDLDGRQPVCRNDIGAPPIPLLPTVLPREALPCPADRVVLGIGERGTDVVTLDFDRQPHLLIIGDTECGKTSTLRLLYRELIRSARPARLLVVDYRRGLLDLIGSEADSQAGADRLAGCAMSAAALAAQLPGLLDVLARRMPSASVTAPQLRDRSWWSGPELYVLVDDYDLVATASGSPLAPLLEYLPHARDLGLHLVLARRSGGAARACYEPVLAALRDLGAMGLMMSADPDDGPLIGAVRPGPLPAGRGTLVTRAGGERLVQVAWSP